MNDEMSQSAKAASKSLVHLNDAFKTNIHRHQELQNSLKKLKADEYANTLAIEKLATATQHTGTVVARQNAQLGKSKKIAQRFQYGL